MDTIELPPLPPQPPPMPPVPPPAPRKRRGGLIIGMILGSMVTFCGLCGVGGVLAYTSLNSAWEQNKPEPPQVVDVSPPPASPTVTPSATAAPVMATVPDVTGKRLSDAQAQLKIAGFESTAPSDITGQGRLVINSNNWIVRSQLPEAGAKIATSTSIRLNVSKPSDKPVDPVTVGVVPKVVCHDLTTAKDLLRSAGFDQLSSKDGTGEGRSQFIDRNWLVVKQSAKAGSRPDPGTKIVLTVVKYGESTGGSGCRS